MFPEPYINGGIKPVIKLSYQRKRGNLFAYFLIFMRLNYLPFLPETDRTLIVDIVIDMQKIVNLFHMIIIDN